MKQVRIEWIDSLSGDTNWHLLDEKIDYKPLEVTTLGFVIESHTDYVVVAQSFAKRYPQYCNTITIPRSAITRIETLGEDKL